MLLQMTLYIIVFYLLGSEYELYMYMHLIRLTRYFSASMVVQQEGGSYFSWPQTCSFCEILEDYQDLLV